MSPTAATSMLTTDAVDNFDMLVTNFLYPNGANLTKNPQYNDSITNIDIHVVA